MTRWVEQIPPPLHGDMRTMFGEYMEVVFLQWETIPELVKRTNLTETQLVFLMRKSMVNMQPRAFALFRKHYLN